MIEAINSSHITAQRRVLLMAEPGTFMYAVLVCISFGGFMKSLYLPVELGQNIAFGDEIKRKMEISLGCQRAHSLTRCRLDISLRRNLRAAPDHPTVIQFPMILLKHARKFPDGETFKRSEEHTSELQS